MFYVSRKESISSSLIDILLVYISIRLCVSLYSSMDIIYPSSWMQYSKRTLCSHLLQSQPDRTVSCQLPCHQCTILTLSHPTPSCLTQRSKLPFSYGFYPTSSMAKLISSLIHLPNDAVSNNNWQKASSKLYSRVADKRN